MISWLTRLAKRIAARGSRPTADASGSAVSIAPDAPRLADLEGRIALLVEANPECFPPRDARPVLLGPLLVEDGVSTRIVVEHDGELEVRRLLGFDPVENTLTVLRGSFFLDDAREPAAALDSPTILAWRLIEDLVAVADELEETEELRDDRRRRRETPAPLDLAAYADRVIAANPACFPPWLVDRVDLGVQVLGRPIEGEPDALGMFEETPAGLRILLSEPNLRDEVAGMSRAALARETLITLCHEFEHAAGFVKGYDALGAREDFFDAMRG
jgi:hypothetical protein